MIKTNHRDLVPTYADPAFDDVFSLNGIALLPSSCSLYW